MFYDNLKEECELQGLKITPLVLECGGNKGALSGWKKGASPNSDIVMKISVRLNVPADYLLFGRQNKANEQDPDEQRLITAYRKLTDEGKRAVLHQAENFSKDPFYQKYTDISKDA